MGEPRHTIQDEHQAFLREKERNVHKLVWCDQKKLRRYQEHESGIRQRRPGELMVGLLLSH